MPTIWIVVAVLGALLLSVLLGLVSWKVLAGKQTIASVVVSAGEPFVLPVPASAKRRELWIRYGLTLSVPAARGTSVSPGSFYGVTLRLEQDGTSRFLGRGGLAPESAEHFGLVDYMHTFSGSFPNQTLATTVKVVDVVGEHATTIHGVLELAPANKLIEARVWATG